MSNNKNVRKVLKDVVRLSVHTAGCVALAVYAHGAHAEPIDLFSPLSAWDIVVEGDRFDPARDQPSRQSRTALDLVGDAGHPLLAASFDSNDTPDYHGDDEFAVRVRLGGALSDRGFNGNLWLGVDADMDGDVDALVRLLGDGASRVYLAVYAAGSDVNDSPSTTSALNPTLVDQLWRDDDYTFLPVDATSDPDSSNTDLNGNGGTDYFLSFKVSWTALADAINTKPLTGEGGALIRSLNDGDGLTPRTSVQWVVFASANDNRLLGDVAGYHDRDDDLRTSYLAQDAFVQLLTLANVSPRIVSGGGTDEVTLTVLERTTAVTQIQARDANGDDLTYRIAGGDDADMFDIDDASGALTFRELLRFNSRADNTYRVEISVSDGRGGEDMQALTIQLLASDVEPDTVLSTVDVADDSLPADGVASTNVIVQLRDPAGEHFGVGGDAVVMTASDGTLGDVVDHGDGSYSSTYTAATTPQTIAVTATVNGMSLLDDADIDLVPAAVALGRTQITFADSELMADGQASTTITVQLRDANDNLIVDGNDEVQLQTDWGSIGPVTADPDGSFRAEYTAPTDLDSAIARVTVSVQVNDRPAGSAELRLVRENPDPQPTPQDPEPSPGDPAPDGEEPGTNGQPLDPAGTPGKPGAEQAQPTVKTAVRGAGSVNGAWLLWALTILPLARYGRKAHPLRKVAIAIAAVILFFPIAASAHFHDCEPDRQVNFEEVHCWYGGISYGRSELAPETEGTAWQLEEEVGTAIGVVAGYQFLPHWFAELSYHDLGEVEFGTANTSGNAVPSLSYEVPSFMVGYSLAEPSSRLNIFFKAGIAKIMNDSAGNAVDFETDTSAQLALGAGLQLSFGPHWHVRAEIHSFDKDARAYGITLIRRGGFVNPFADRY